MTTGDGKECTVDTRWADLGSDPVLHAMVVGAGCVLALAPALLPSWRAGAGKRWPYVVMAFGMAAGHLDGVFVVVAVLALLVAGWLCGAPSRRAEVGHHLQDFVLMSVLLVLAALGGPGLDGSWSGHAHAGGSLGAVALLIGLGWTGARLARVLLERGGDRRALGRDACSAGMAASMAFMAALAL
ncbi:unnamed protein product [[Actinomadura] parvosata subsp. kistnae]|uniref:DUF5134 domain-containing protein n=1 Tax=[Actinomadura] parvosata subsp. kistnae TaxID=1909395 RepID=A0A1V0A1D8_9ACTN|nr:hypothetical protein [Nonomuraea sp. ATCC 55076]AQZ64025.1 hypothetical protein BKM31_23470 [Nonomuraea sp. ATCC 55076]SPL89908.1 unnamed protein product [Actinomadura parvosata subsp. kistnae]